MKKTTVYGLVLSGGKSLRMGKDKGQIQYHGVPQSIYLYNLLEKVCDNTFISIRQDQRDQYDASFNIITDRDQFRGPFNGLLSAHQEHPEVAWLVMACDLPLMDQLTLELLLAERDPSQTATALATRKTSLPEPLAAIWEPAGLKQAEIYMADAESSCPRKYLINSDTKLVYPKTDLVLLNANSEEEYLEVLKKLSPA